MHEIPIEGETGRSRILVGERLEHLTDYLPGGQTVIVTDQTVGTLYGDRFPPAEVITIGSGENHKTLETLASIYDRLIEIEADRSSFIVGIGGGIVGDVTGFAASTYMRGVRFGFVPTTLLAQVDATVGGKNGVNFRGYKNMVGVFNQPDFVIADITLLETLSPKEIACGLAEIVKHGCIADADYFDFIEAHSDAITRLDHDTMSHLVSESVRIKAAVVTKDEREAGERRKLNFGHTLGHAFEKTLRISHGEAVSAGMVMASDLSVRKGLLDKKASQRIATLLHRLKLPVDIDFDRRAVFQALKKDKKREKNQMHFVLLESIGKAVVESINLPELENWIVDHSRR